MDKLDANLGRIELDATLTNIKVDANLIPIQVNADLSNIILDAYIGRGFKLLSDLVIGDEYGGGKIAYQGEEFDNGFIAHPMWEYDTSGILWGCRGTEIGSMGVEIGDGENNTMMISHELNGCDEKPNAASECVDSDTNGYSDWYLPSIDELIVLYENGELLGGFAYNQAYWSSTEFDSERAWRHIFALDWTNTSVKNDTAQRVRPIRNY
jgi:hypothetical protein